MAEAAALSQEKREFALGTPLGDDVLLLESMVYEERMGRCFTMHIEALSLNPNIGPDDLLGENVTVRAATQLDASPEGTPRFFNGYVSSIRLTPEVGRYFRYRLTVSPWLWFLSQTSDCRIFQDMSTPEIIQDVFRTYGFTDFKLSLSGEYPKREYCVQYRETALAFVCRLMEEDGIFFFYEHENGMHTVVLGDDNVAYATVPGYERIRLNPSTTPWQSDTIDEVEVTDSLRSSEYTLNDYDFENPPKSLISKSVPSGDHARKPLPRFDYPGGYTVSGEGDRYANVWQDIEHATRKMLIGRGATRGLSVGHRFAIGRMDDPAADPEHAALKGEFVPTAQRVELRQNLYESGDAEAWQGYRCTFEAVPADVLYRTPRLTPRPLIRGPQTAFVVGQSGQEITVDKHGRVKLMFHWDRYAPGDETSSCWVRVSQLWAGKSWGAMWIPRIGQEVIVEFLEGDPDRPIITGRVYNGANKPPYDPVGMPTVSTIKSNSSKGGEGFNELRFEDKKGEEQLFLHAERQMDIRAKEDRYETIGQDRHLVVERHKHEHIKFDRNEEIDQDHKEHVKRDYGLTVDGKTSVKVGSTLSVEVADDVAEVFDANQGTDIGGELHIKAKGKIVIESGDHITIKVGGSYVAIDSSGVTVGSDSEVELKAGSAIKQKSDGTFKAEASGTFDAKGGGPVTVESSAVTNVKGSAVKIN